MFAQLTYDTGASLVNVLNDMVIALTGGATSAMSANLNQAQSSIDNVPGGTPTWAFVADATAMTDNPDITSGTFLGGKIIKQPSATSVGNPDKFLKFGFITSGATSTVLFAIHFGKANSSGSLTGYAKFLDVNKCTTAIGVRNASVFNHALKVQIYSSANATLIQIAQGDLFTYKPCLAVLDFAKISADLDVSGNICTVVSNCVPASANQNFMYLASTVVDGKTFPGTGLTNTPRSSVVIGTTDINNVLDLLAVNTYKYEGFSKIGSRYDLLNIGITRFSMRNTETNSQTWYTDNMTYKQIPFSSITDVTGVYGCNIEAFGKDGAFYSTPVGTMCKFGMFMVGV